MEQPYNFAMLYCQLHACWCPCDTRSQGISRNGIDQISWNIPFLASEELMQLMGVDDNHPFKVMAKLRITWHLF